MKRFRRALVKYVAQDALLISGSAEDEEGAPADKKPTPEQPKKPTPEQPKAPLPKPQEENKDSASKPWDSEGTVLGIGGSNWGAIGFS